MIVVRPPAGFLLTHPAHFIAFGFGSGLAPFAPGTFGTLLGWVLALIAFPLAPMAALALLGALFMLGVWACGVAGRHLGTEDHGAMVWDEVVAFMLVLALVPRDLAWQAAAFVLFRFFDIAKPPPIRMLERRYHGGFGVMVDDLLAAGYTLLVLAIVKRLFL